MVIAVSCRKGAYLLLYTPEAFPNCTDPHFQTLRGGLPSLRLYSLTSHLTGRNKPISTTPSVRNSRAVTPAVSVDCSINSPERVPISSSTHDLLLNFNFSIGRHQESFKPSGRGFATGHQPLWKVAVKTESFRRRICRRR